MEAIPDKYEKLIGAHMPLSFWNYLNLYAVARRTVKTRIIRTVLENWGEQTKLINSEDFLISEIVLHYEILWDRTKALFPKEDTEEGQEKFFKQVRTELEKKNLTKRHIDFVITRLR